MTAAIQESILLVEDDSGMRSSCSQALVEEGYHVFEASSPREAELILLREVIDLVVTDLRMPDGGGERVLEYAKNVSPSLPVILITAYPSVESAINAFKGGVVDYILKPFSGDQLLDAINRALDTSRATDRAALLRKMSTHVAHMPEVIGGSDRFHALLADARRVALLDGNVLILGPPGSGKELVAKIIHGFSRRSNGPFVTVNCAAIPQGMQEAEIFGFERGLFSESSKAKAGLLEQANRGSLFLDEVTCLTPSTQARLLEAFEKKTSCRLGATTHSLTDVRLLSTTNQDAREEARQDRLRDDLFFCLSALEIRVPSLQERPQDIPALAIFFLDQMCAENNKAGILGFTDGALEFLTNQTWSGNVRELRNVIQKAFAETSGPLISVDDVKQTGAFRAFESIEKTFPEPHRKAFNEFERRYLTEALMRHKGNVTRTAATLGIHRSTLQRHMKKLGIKSN